MQLGPVELRCTKETWTPEDFLENRFEWFKNVNESLRVFSSLLPEQKEAVVRMVQRALYLAADEVQEWLPEAFSPNTVSDTLVLELRLSTSQVEAEIADRKKYTSKRLEEMAASIRDDVESIEST